MNTVDIVLGIILLLAFYWGFKKGLLVTLTSLIGLIAGVYGAVYFSDYVGAYLAHWFDWSPQTTKWASFAVTFLLIVLVLNVLGKFLTKIADFTSLGLLNKLLGGLFSTLQYGFIISVVFLFFNSSNLMGYVISEEKKEGSFLYKHIETIAPWVMPALIKEFKKIHAQTPESSEKTSLE
ncbi:MAG: CvpA family protein [Flavobacteriaceae bacterium]